VRGCRRYERWKNEILDWMELWYALSQACMPSRYPSLITKTISFAHSEYPAGSTFSETVMGFLRKRGKRFRKAARARTVDTPRRLSAPSPVQLNQDALMTIASVPDVLGEARMA
jgi:hypothetical protein